MTQPNWKKKPWRDKRYGLFVRELPCCLTGDYATDYMAVDPHHEPDSSNRGMSTKPSDERQIAVRHDLHVLMESPGHSREEVYAKYGVDPEQVIAETQRQWVVKYGKGWEGGTCKKGA